MASAIFLQAHLKHAELLLEKTGISVSFPSNPVPKLVPDKATAYTTLSGKGLFPVLMHVQLSPRVTLASLK